MNEINPAFLALIPAVWLAISFALSRLSGWSKLARQFPATGPVKGARAIMRSGTIGVIKYYSCLTFCANDEGLLIAIALPLRPGHRPIFIPWDQFHHIADSPVLFSHQIRMSIGKPTITRVVFPGWVKYHMPYELRSS